MSAEHWNRVYGTKGDDVSWFEPDPRTSVELVAAYAPDPAAPVVDVGGGASTLAGVLVAAGRTDVTVVDLSREALERARARGDAPGVTWVAADVTAWVPPRAYALWHDRAVFHFLVDEPSRTAYRAALAAGTADGSYAVVATFAPDGPESCSGLPVRRYDAEALAGELGAPFRLVESRRVAHRTPWGAEQPFTVVVARREAG